MGKPWYRHDPGVLALIALLAAFACVLSSADAGHAAREGAAMAQAREAYSVRPWVLWDRKNPFAADRGRAGLDAVVVETPYERVRYEAYLQRLQALPVTTNEIERWRRDASGNVGFVVYAHSRSAADSEATFLEQFANATLTLRPGESMRASSRAIFGARTDFYDVGTLREERYTGSLTYRFTPGNDRCRRSGTLRFADGYGKRYWFAFDLGRYR
jgi:hypothetical protein